MPKYLIANEEYQLKPSTLKDYKKLNLLLKESGSGLNIDVSSDQKALLSIGNFLNNLLESDLIEKFLSIVLRRTKWADNETPELTYEKAEEIEESVLVEVIKDFFSSKKELMGNIASSFKNLKKNTSEQTDSLNL